MLNKLHRLVIPLLISSLRFSKMANCSPKKTALVVITEGSEDMEFVISVDILRRAEIDVTIANLDGVHPTKLKTGTIVVPDASLENAVKKTYDAVVLPGGPGYKNFCKSARLGDLLRDQERCGRLIAAICAAPVVLSYHNIAPGKLVTCYPSTKEEMGSNYNVTDDNVVTDGNIITSRGPGTAFDFALAIVAKMLGDAAAKPVAEAMLIKY